MGAGAARARPGRDRDAAPDRLTEALAPAEFSVIRTCARTPARARGGWPWPCLAAALATSRGARAASARGARGRLDDLGLAGRRLDPAGGELDDALARPRRAAPAVRSVAGRAHELDDQRALASAGWPAGQVTRTVEGGGAGGGTGAEPRKRSVGRGAVTSGASTGKARRLRGGRLAGLGGGRGEAHVLAVGSQRSTASADTDSVPASQVTWSGPVAGEQGVIAVGAGEAVGSAPPSSVSLPDRPEDVGAARAGRVSPADPPTTFSTSGLTLSPSPASPSPAMPSSVTETGLERGVVVDRVGSGAARDVVGAAPRRDSRCRHRRRSCRRRWPPRGCRRRRRRSGRRCPGRRRG